MRGFGFDEAFVETEADIIRRLEHDIVTLNKEIQEEKEKHKTTVHEFRRFITLVVEETTKGYGLSISALHNAAGESWKWLDSERGE